MSRHGWVQFGSHTFVGVTPKVTYLVFAGKTEFREMQREFLGLVLPVEKAHNMATVGHGTVPYIAALAIKGFVEWMTDKTVGVESQHLDVCIKAQIIADGRGSVASSNGAASKQLQRNYKLFLSIGGVSIETCEVTVEYRLTFAGEMTPVGETVELIPAIRPIGPTLASLIAGSKTPCPLPCIAYYTKHVAVFRLKFSVVVEVGHYK